LPRKQRETAKDRALKLIIEKDGWVERVLRPSHQTRARDKMRHVHYILWEEEAKWGELITRSKLIYPKTFYELLEDNLLKQTGPDKWVLNK
jgi:hypothetical protein